MALIYAFCDEAGQWHGDPAGDQHDVHHQPDEATLTFHPATGEPGASSPFAGQKVRVLVASIGEACPGQIQYRLDDGRSHYATADVEELLFGDDVQEAWAGRTWPPTSATPTPARPPATPLAADPAPLYWQISDAGRHYDLTATPGPDGLTIAVVGADDDGRITAELNGHLRDAGHLALLGRLFLAAAANPDPRQPGPATTSRRGGDWSDEEIALVIRRHRDGAEVDAIAAELGRSANSIRYKLYGLRLGPFPGPAASTNPAAPRQQAQPKPPPAYTMADLRETHSNSHKRWEPAEDAQLARRAAEGATVAELMAEFGRNEGAITSRLARVAPDSSTRSSLPGR